MRKLLALIALTLCACGGGLQPGEVTTGHWTALDGGQDERRVIGRNQIVSWHDWTRTPWWRPSDDMTTAIWYYVITHGNAVCVTDASLWTIIPDGAMLACKWRMPQ